MPNFVNPFYAEMTKSRETWAPDTRQIDKESARKQIVGEEGERVLREYAEKEKQEISQGVKTEAEYSVPALKHIYVPRRDYAPLESEPDWKEKARRVKIRTKNREKGRKTLTPHATSLTLPIFKYETQKRSAVKDIPPDQLAEMKKTFFNKQWHTYKFDQEYLGRHYAEVRDEMEELRAFLNAFSDGNGLDTEEKEQISSLRDLYTVMENTISAFIAMHCIVRADEDGHTVFRVSQSPPDEAAEDRYNQQKDTLRRYIGGRSAEAEMERLFSERRYELNKDALSKDMINNNQVNLSEVDDFLNHLYNQRYQTNYQQNKELIDLMAADLKRIAELWDYARREAATWGGIIGDLKEQGGDESVQKIAYARSRIERMHPRLRAFSRRTDGLMRTVKYLMKGEVKQKSLPGSEVWSLLDSYRRALPAKEGEKKKPEKVDVKCYAAYLNEKEQLFDEAWKRYAAKPENSAMKEKLLGDEKKMAVLKEAAVLMNSEDNAYNDRALALMIRLEELKEQDDDYRNSEKGKKEIAAVGRETEIVISPIVSSIMHYRMGDYRSFTNDELISKQKEIYELTGGIKICWNILGGIPSDVPGLTVWDKLFDRPVPTGKDEEDDPSPEMQKYNMRESVFEYKMRTLRQLKKRIRAAMMLSGEAMEYADGSLEQILNENELERFKLKMQAEQGNTTAKEKLYRFAWDRILMTATNIDGYERTIGQIYADKGEFDCLKNVETMTVQNADKQLSVAERRTHYDSIAMRYEHLAKKYGYEIPDFYWILLHWDEMFADAESIKGNLSLIEKDKEVLKEDDQKDQRLLHLARYYDHYMEAALGILQKGLWHSEKTPSQFEAIRINIAEYMAEVSQDREYLMTVPPGDGMAVPEEVKAEH